MIQLQAEGTGSVRGPFRLAALSAAVLGALAVTNGALAMEIPTGDEDLVVRWDNTVRYNAGFRAQDQKSAILKNPNADDGDRNFKNGSMVTNRLDVLSEFDVVWQGKFGARVSAAGWYDQAYSSLDGTSTGTSNTLLNGLPVAGQLSDYSSRYAKGASGEWLDAFVFGTFDLGETPVSVKVGQHTVYWGEGLFLGGVIHGITYSQTGLDAWKGQSSPGTEAKELFRPRGGLTISAQPASDLTIAGQWFYNWQGVRTSESGSYLSANDFLLFGADSYIVGANPFFGAVPGAPAALRAWNTGMNATVNSASLGDWGLSARWSPDWLDGTLGFYYRNTTDILPQLLLTPGVASIGAGACRLGGGQSLSPTSCLLPQGTTARDLQKYGKYGTYQTAFGGGIDIFGVSLGKNIGGVSVGAELSYRKDMPLVSEAVTVLPAALSALTPGSIANTALPEFGDTPGARGNTFHGLFNAIATFGNTPLWNAATLQAELSWMYMDKVTQNEAVYKGRTGYNALDKANPFYYGLAVNFTPTWFQVFPGVDLTMPLTWSQGINGNAAVAFGGNEGTGAYSVGVGANIYQKYLVNLNYNGYFGDYTTVNGVATVFNGSNASLSDRGWVSLTLKTTF